MKLDRTIEDCKFWLEKYTTSFKSSDRDFKTIQKKLEGQMEIVLHEAQKCVTEDDMKINFKTLNDMMFVKFSQLEDTKQGMRDTLTFIKYFYPMQM